MKIGVFDSGLGGLTVVKALTDMIKGADFFYIADTAHAPYGEKTPEEILQFSLDITRYFIDHFDIDALVIACNTATSAAISVLRDKYPELIIVGTEPGVKPAIETTRTGKVGVLATPATLKGEKYQHLVDIHAKEKNVQLYEQACPGLVEQIEAGRSEHPDTHAMLEEWLYPMRDAKVDTIVLGCTHYPLVGKLIENIMEHELTLIHTGEAIARRLLSLSKTKGHDNHGSFELRLYTTGTIDRSIVSLLLGYELPIQKIVI